MKVKKLLSAIIAIAMMTASSVGVTAFAEEGTTAILDTSESQTEATSETSVSDEDAVAKIGDENYASLQSAIKNATSGQTVTLVDDVLLGKIAPFFTSGNDEYYSAITIGKDKKITLDLNHHSIKWSDEAKNAPDGEGKTGNYDIFWLSEGSELKVVGEGIIDGDVGKSSRWARIFWVKQGANLIIDSGEYYALQVILFNTYSGASATINGGTFGVSESYTNDEIANIINASGKNVLEKIYGGTFKGVDPRCFEDGDSAVAEGCKVSKKGDNYTVLSADTEAVASVIVPQEKLSGFAQSRNIGEYFYTSLADAVAEAESGDTVTLLDNASGDGVIVPSGKNITIDLGGYTYNVDGTTVGSAGTETQAFQLLKDSNITIKNGTIKSDKAKMLIQNYSNLTLENVTLDGRGLVGTNRYVLSNNNGDTVLKGNTNIIAKEGDFAFDCYYWPSNGYTDGVTVTLDTDFTGKIIGKIEMSDDGTDSANAASKQSISICAENYCIFEKDGVYEVVTKLEAGIIDANKDGEAEENTNQTAVVEAINNPDNKVTNANVDTVISAIESITDKEVQASIAPEKIAAIVETKTGTEISTEVAAAYAIDETYNVAVESVEETAIDTTTGLFVKEGDKVYSVDVTTITGDDVTETDTPVLVRIPIANADSVTSVVHIHNGEATQIKNFTTHGTYIQFVTNKFSNFIVTTAPLATAEINVQFEKKADNEYDIVLTAASSINRFTSADLTFALTPAAGIDMSYEITPATNVNLTTDAVADHYMFSLDGTHEADKSGLKIKVGTVKFEGYGTFNFKVAGASTNEVHAVTEANNLVTTYIPGATVSNLTGNLNLANATLDGEIKIPTKDLTISIAFNNGVASGNTVAYQNMKIDITGVNYSKTIELGDVTDNLFTTVITGELHEGERYEVKVSGLGYRVAKCNVQMTADKELNFWNNVMDGETEVEVGDATTAKKVTFLAGDIVKDTKINIYDLSAVVSYFGKTVNKATETDFAKYDLNRDGKIDSEDAAYVLTSWGN